MRVYLCAHVYEFVCVQACMNLCVSVCTSVWEQGLMPSSTYQRTALRNGSFSDVYGILMPLHTSHQYHQDAFRMALKSNSHFFHLLPEFRPVAFLLKLWRACVPGSQNYSSSSWTLLAFTGCDSNQNIFLSAWIRPFRSFSGNSSGDELSCLCLFGKAQSFLHFWRTALLGVILSVVSFSSF